MESKKPVFYLVICFVVSFCLSWTGEGSGQTKTPVEPLEAFQLGTDNLSNVLGPSSNLRQDSADVAIVSATAYPGHFAKVEVLLKNPVPIAALQFMITISNPDIMNFHIDSVGVDSVITPVDTCTGPPPHGDSCFVDSLVPMPVRYCHIDTTGCLTSGFNFLECRCGSGDTTVPDCNWIEVIGGDLVGSPIPPDSAYRPLFRLGVDVSCLPDSETDRSTSFYIYPGVNSFLSDPYGHLVPFRYNHGELMAWWSVPGDASNDSLVDVGDIVFLINYLFKGGPEPCIMEAADPSGDCVVGPADVVYLINFLFREGDPPLPGCAH